MRRPDTVEMCEFVRILCLPVHTSFFFKKLLLLDISRCMLDKLKTLKVLSFAKKSSVIDFSCCALEAGKERQFVSLLHNVNLILVLHSVLTDGIV